jgi:hypothetical protein
MSQNVTASSSKEVYESLDNYQDSNYLQTFLETHADPISHEKMEHIYSLGCGHSFSYTQFFQDWMKDHGTCPTCTEKSEIPPIRNYSAENLYRDGTSMAEKMDKLAETIVHLKEEKKNETTQLRKELAEIKNYLGITSSYPNSNAIVPAPKEFFTVHDEDCCPVRTGKEIGNALYRGVTGLF